MNRRISENPARWTGFVSTGFVSTGFVSTGFVSTGFVSTGCVSTWHKRLLTGIVGTGLLLPLAGCGGPEALPLPSYDPSGSAAKAMELYDTDGDGFVAGEELEKAPGLNAALKNLDTDSDGKVSEQEVADRVKAWDDSKVGVMIFDSVFLLDGKGLGKAEIVYEPDGFLTNVLKATKGQTDLGGNIIPKIPKEDRPTPTSPPGMQLGIYKVRVSKIVNGKETIPARYNTETTLGQEVSKDDWAISNKQVVYKLESK